VSARHRRWFSRIFGYTPLLGRADFRGDEGQPGRDHVRHPDLSSVEARSGSDPGIIGRQIRMNDEPYTVSACCARPGRPPPAGDVGSIGL